MTARRASALPLVLAVALLLAAVDARAAGWVPSVKVADLPNNQGAPRVATSDDGDVFVAWVADGTPDQLMVTKRPAGGSFEPPETIDAQATANASAPDIAVDGAGNAVLVWVSGNAVRQARRGAGDAQFGPESSLPSAGLQQFDPKLAVNRAGTAIVAWRFQDMTTHGIRVARSTTTTPFPVPGQTYNEGSNQPSAPDIDINEAGDAAVVWQVPGSSFFIRSGYRPGTGGFGASQQVDDTTFLQFRAPQVAVDSIGRSLAIYGAGNEDTIFGAVRPPGAGGSWVLLDNPPQPNEVLTPSAFLNLEFDSQDFAVASWRWGDANQELVHASIRAPGGPLVQFPAEPQAVTPSSDDDNDTPHMETSRASGTSVLAWRRDGDASIRVSKREPGGAFEPYVNLSGAGRTGFEPRTTAGANGNLGVAWRDTNLLAPDPHIRFAAYDATDPSLGAVNVPAGGTTGVPVDLSATATDDWSAPTVSWDFGDGQLAGGQSVSHTYAAAGTYTVTVSALDTAGNRAATTRTIQVSDPGQPPPPPPPPGDLPTIGVDFNASTVRGSVFVSTPIGQLPQRIAARPVVRGAGGPTLRPPRGYTPFRELGKDDNIPVGSILDSTRGISSITMGTERAGVFQTARFSLGAYKTRQGKKRRMTVATLVGGGSFRRACRRRPRGAGAAQRRFARRLFGRTRGRFRTRGRHSTATVRGTRWLTKDSCRGTRTRVTQGSVTVRDLVKRRTVVVRAGRSYLARPRPFRRGRR